MFGLFVLYVVFSLSFVIIFVILLAVSLSSVCSLENISVFFTFVELVVCMGGWMGGGGVPNSVFNKKFRAYS